MGSTPEEEEVGPVNTNEAKPATGGSRFSQFFTKPRLVSNDICTSEILNTHI